MHFCVYFFKTIFLFHFAFVQSQNCNYFDYITVRIKSANRFISSEVNGCFKPETLSPSYITEIYVYEQRIPRLGKNAVTHLLELEEFALSSVNLADIEPQTFRDLPKLIVLQISSNNIRNISEGIFQSIPSIRRLLIFSNNINHISSHAFDDLPLLREVQLQNNDLDYWNTKWFENCIKLEELYIENNKISIIPRGAFASLVKLRRIDMTGNKITTIESGAFQGMKKIGYLNLAHNKLTDIDEGAFPGIFKIGTLHINGNYLNFLSSELLEKISVKKIYLDFNPWECYCLFDIYHWITATKGSLMIWNNCDSNFVPVCAHPESNSQMCRGYVDENLTSRYIGFLKNVSAPIGRYCAMLN